MSGEYHPLVIQVEPSVEFITTQQDPEWASRGLRHIELCGRVSHRSEGRVTETSADPFVRKIAIKSGHESILEHVSFTALFVGSRAMSHQLVRHRLCSITQESMRYCNYADGAKHSALKIIVPPSVDANSECVEEFLLSAASDYACYCKLIELGCPAEDARYLLPHCTATAVYVTANVREWRHIFKMRYDKHAQWEIRELAQKVYEHFAALQPVFVEGLK